MFDDRDIVPDDTLLRQIFGHVQPPEAISILLQNWEKCVFRIESSAIPACIVRFEVEKEDKNHDAFNIIAAIQQLAATVIPDLVPKTLQVGKAKNAQGQSFKFSVMQLVDGVVLDEVWQQMSVDEQEAVVEELVEALRKLHAISSSDVTRDSELWKYLNQPDTFGGPHTGFLNNGSAFLESAIDRRRTSKQSCTITADSRSHGIVIKSSFEALGSKSISYPEPDTWAKEAVLCHNDLTPRNLILCTSATGQYRLAGIIDWEMAGFYPASYELSLQDTYLGCGNQQTSFYLLLKRHMSAIVPRSPSQTELLEAMEFIFEAQQKAFLEGNNISAHIRVRFLTEAHLFRDSDLYLGWTRATDNCCDFEYSKTALRQLEDSVIEEMTERRKSKMKPSS